MRVVLRSLVIAVVVTGGLNVDVADVSANSPASAIAGTPRGAAGSIAAGFHHTCALLRDGTIRCWGAGDKGQVGAEPPTSFYSAPREAITMQEPAISVVAGYEHNCALLADHVVRCWGDAAHGKLAIPFTTGGFGFPFEAQLGADLRPTQLALGRDHSCALLDDGAFTCWGSDDFGQLGNGAAVGDVGMPTQSVGFPGGRVATALAAGGNHTCALLDDGSVTCWGRDDFGQLGNGAAGDREAPLDLVALPSGHRAEAITASQFHTCAVLDDGRVSCWGRGSNGQLGDGTLSGSTVPQPPLAMPGGRSATSITAGDTHTCALLHDGAVSCWGFSSDGQLGTTSTNSPSAPIALPGARAIVAGSQHTCAVLIDDRVTCWGRDDVGQVGNGAPSDDVLVPPAAISAVQPPDPGPHTVDGGTSHTCAVSVMQTVYCWGARAEGRLGLGDATPGIVPEPTSPVDLPGDARAVAVATGESFTCALLDTGRVSCWGLNTSGQLGLGSTGAPASTPSGPLTMPGGRLAIEISAGDVHACALLDDGSVACWGGDSFGQVGNGGGASGSVATPTLVDLGARTATHVGLGSTHSCATLDDGRVSCWGEAGNGRLGNGTVTPNVVAPGPPIAMPGAVDAVAITGGDFHTCALLENGTFACWGYDGQGQLANYAGGSLLSPGVTDPMWGTPVVSIVAGDSHTCMTNGDGDFACAGADSSGQIGDGVDANNNDPHPNPDRELLGAVNAIGMAAGSAHTCVVLSLYPNGLSATLWCWGADAAGQLGNGSPAQNNGDWGNQSLVRMIGDLEVALPAAVPAPPDPLIADVGARSATIDWMTPDDGGAAIDHYVVQLSGADGSAWSDAGATTGPETVLALSELTPGAHKFRIAAVNAVGQGPWSGPSALTVIPGEAVTIAPVRLLDTRPDGETIDDQFERGGVIASGQSLEIQIAGRGSIPADADGAILNVTVTQPAGAGFLTVHPCGQLPNASTVNYTHAGQTVPNLTVARLSATGSVCVYALTTTHVLIDATGYLPDGSLVTTITPSRLLDTRAGETTVDGQFQAIGVVPGGTSIEIPIGGRAGVPGNAAAVLANITVTQPVGAGFVAAYPCDAVPNASTVNYTHAGHTVPNAAVVKLSPTGSLCLYALTTTHLIVDVSGFIPAGTSVNTVAPARLLDTRPGGPTVDGQQSGAGPIIGGTSIEVPIAGRGGVPLGASTAILNVTVTNPAGFGFVTIYACTAAPPNASNLNFAPGQTVPNAVVVQLSASGTVCAFSPTTTDLIIDVTGYA